MESNKPELLQKKFRRVCAHLKNAYGFKGIKDIAEYAGEKPRFIYNLLYNPGKRFLKGPPLDRMYNFCKTYDLSLDYFADYNKGERSNFQANRPPDLFTLQTEFKATGNLKYFHMATGYLAGLIDQVEGCNTYLFYKGRFGIIDVMRKREDDLKFITFYDEKNLIRCGHTYSEPENLQGIRPLSEAYAQGIKEKL